MTYNNIEKRRIALRDWLKRNPHKIKEYNKKYKEKKREWREKNKEKLKIRIEKWRQKNLKHVLSLQKIYYQKNKIKHNFLGKQRLIKRKLLCFQKYTKGSPECNCCGEKEVKFLSIDHLNGGGRMQRLRIGGGGDHMYRWLIKNNFPSGFQVLCHNCNQAKGSYGVCPHGN